MAKALGLLPRRDFLLTPGALWLCFVRELKKPNSILSALVVFDEAAALSAPLLGDGFQVHSSVSGCDGWGWKLDNACNSQAHGRGGIHAFWVVNEILGDLGQERILCYVWMCQQLLPWPAMLPEGERAGSKQRQDCKHTPQKVTFLSTACLHILIRKGSLTQQARGSPLLTELIPVMNIPCCNGDWTNSAQTLVGTSKDIWGWGFYKGCW